MMTNRTSVLNKIIASAMAIIIIMVNLSITSYADAKRRNIIIVNPISFLFYNAGESFQCSVLPNDTSGLVWSLGKVNLSQGHVDITSDGLVTSSNNACGVVEVVVTDRYNDEEKSQTFNIQPAVNSITVKKSHVYIPDPYKAKLIPIPLKFSPNVDYPWDPCEYTTSDENIAAVTYEKTYKTAYIAPMGKNGTCTITAKARNGKGKASIKVTVGESEPTTKPSNNSSNSSSHSSNTSASSNKNTNSSNKPNNSSKPNDSTGTVETKQTIEEKLEDVLDEDISISDEELQEEHNSTSDKLNVLIPEININTKNKVEFNWESVAGVDGYALYISNDDEFKLVYYGPDTSYTLNNFEFDKNYKVKMKCYQSQDKQRLFSDFGNEQNFKTRKTTIKDQIETLLNKITEFWK